VAVQAMRERQPRISNADYDIIPRMVQAGMSAAQIAARFGVTVGSLRVMCSKRGISFNPNSERERHWVVPLPDVIRNDIRRMAHTLGLTGPQLIQKLVEHIVLDDLYSAVLDESLGRGDNPDRVSVPGCNS
jgi:hypothetical protein